MTQESLFPCISDAFAKGYVYEADFLGAAEEAALLAHLRQLPLTAAEYKEFKAKRRIVTYGGRYDFSARQLHDAEPIAPFLHPLRERIAKWAGRPAEQFSRYPPKPRERSVAIELAPRSIYRLEGESRWDWQHSIPPTPALRYSITFRTLRAASTM
jgi:alkylated DNA repair dioxygenase AlkB